MYRNLYAQGFDGSVVTMDGYLEHNNNFIVSGNLINEMKIGDTTHT